MYAYTQIYKLTKTLVHSCPWFELTHSHQTMKITQSRTGEIILGGVKLLNAIFSMKNS